MLLREEKRVKFQIEPVKQHAIERYNYLPANVCIVYAFVPTSPCFIRHLETIRCFSGHMIDKFGHAGDIGFAKAYVQPSHALARG
jgi:hypothetical protein